MKMNLPNKLTVLRMIMIPFFMFIIMFPVLGQFWSRIAAAAIFGLTALTDMLDGKIARKYNLITDFGKFLDPVADKLTQLTIAVMLLIDFRQADNATINAFAWVFLVFLIKELVMLAGGLIMLTMNIRPGAAEIWGKVATTVFYVGMTVIIAIGPEVGALNEMLGFELPGVLTGIIVVICAIMTIVAFLSYMPETFRQFKEHFAEKKAAKTK